LAEAPKPADDADPVEDVEPEVTKLTRGEGRSRISPADMRKALETTNLCKPL
jgi:hypothetical protein